MDLTVPFCGGEEREPSFEVFIFTIFPGLVLCSEQRTSRVLGRPSAGCGDVGAPSLGCTQGMRGSFVIWAG